MYLKKSLHVALLAGLFSIAFSSLAASSKNETFQYSWKDGTGLVHFSDHVTRDAIKYGYKVYNGMGTLVKTVPRELTAAEIKAKQAADAQKAKKEAEIQAEQEKDLQMLQAYPTLSVYQDYLDQYVSAAARKVKNDQYALETSHQNLANLLQSASAQEGKVPVFMQKQIAAQQKRIVEEQAQLKQDQKNLDDIKSGLKEKIRHYKVASQKYGPNTSGS